MTQQIDDTIKQIPKDESINYTSYLLQAIESRFGKSANEIMYKQIEYILNDGAWGKEVDESLDRGQ